MKAPTITEFLLARIAADESLARQVQDGPGEPGGWGLWSVTIGVQDDQTRFAHVASTPARVLRECAAKRALIEYSPPKTLRHLAAIYSDHPDYQDAWAL